MADAPFGVNGGASATLADMSVFGGVDGVNDGESTLNFPRPMLFAPFAGCLCEWGSWLNEQPFPSNRQCP